ncbi:MAG: hypothetical protein IT518_00325 [Burkholderiales bacterium]|nr:hypothetical protein [Burkholderiales bacterium]
MSMHLCRNLLLGAIACAASICGADAQTTFRIKSLYSNLDGAVQYIVLAETAGLNGQHRFAGLKLAVTRNGVTREYTFAHDLPSENTANASLVVATAPLPFEIEGTVNLAYACCVEPDYRLPVRFLPVDGATVEFAGVDRVTYSALPFDGAKAVERDGTIVRAELPTSACPPGVSSSCQAGARLYVTSFTATAVEYYNADRDHYFITALATEIDALDTARTAGWRRTGVTFTVGSRPFAMLNWSQWDKPPPEPFPMQAVCRFYLPPEVGDSHFFSASEKECAEVRERRPQFVFETEAAFYALLPDATGQCPRGEGFILYPVFRLFNMRVDVNHRYLVNLFIRNAMIEQGWLPEGYGPAGVAFCTP